MKRFLFIFISFVFMLSGLLSLPADRSFAQSSTKSSVPTSEGIEKINKKVDELKDKIASRVAQLKLVEKRGIIGTVENVSDIQITLKDINGKNRIVDVDEFTKFSDSDEDSDGISGIKKGAKISVLGLYNKESRRILARFVNEVTIPVFSSGVISKKDEENFTITLATQDRNDFLIDIEKITKTFSYNQGDLEISGFSKIEVLQNALVIGFLDPKENDRITASRIIIFPNIPKNPKIPVILESASVSPTPIKTNTKVENE